MSMINNLPKDFLMEFKTDSQRKDVARHYIEDWMSIIEDQEPWAETVEKSIRVYDRVDPHVFNYWKLACKYNQGATIPDWPRPSVEHIPTHNQMQDRTNRGIADIYRQIIQREIDNSEFNLALKQSIKSAIVTGRGAMTIDVRRATQKYPIPCLQFKSYPWNRFFVKQLDQWSEVEIVMTMEKVLRTSLGDWSDESFNPTVDNAASYEANDNTGRYIKQDDKDKYVHILKVYDKTDYTITLIWMENGRVIARYKDPYNINNFLPIPIPIQPHDEFGQFWPRCEFEDIMDAQEQLDMIQMKKESMINAIAVKGAVTIDNEELKKIWEDDKNKLVPIADPGVAEAIRQGGQRGLDSFIHIFDINPQLTAIQALSEQEERFKLHMQEMTGISDIFMGQSDPNDTATSQVYKSMYGDVRLRNLRQSIQTSIRSAFEVMFEMVKQYPLDIIQYKSKYDLEVPQMTEEQLQNATRAEIRKIRTKQGIIQKLQQPESSDKYRIDLDTQSMQNLDMQQKIEQAGMVDAIIEQIISTYAPIASENPSLALAWLKARKARLDSYGLDRGERINLAEALDILIDEQEDEVENLKDPQYLEEKENLEAQRMEKLDPETKKATAALMTAEATAQKTQVEAEHAPVKQELEIEKTTTDIEISKRKQDLEEQKAEDDFENKEREIKVKDDQRLDDKQKADKELEQKDRELDQKDRELDIEETNSEAEIELEQTRMEEEIKQNERDDDSRNIATDVSVEST